MEQLHSVACSCIKKNVIMKIQWGHATQNLAGCVSAKFWFGEQFTRYGRDVDTAHVMRHEDTYTFGGK